MAAARMPPHLFNIFYLYYQRMTHRAATELPGTRHNMRKRPGNVVLLYLIFTQNREILKAHISTKPPTIKYKIPTSNTLFITNFSTSIFIILRYLSCACMFQNTTIHMKFNSCVRIECLPGVADSLEMPHGIRNDSFSGRRHHYWIRYFTTYNNDRVVVETMVPAVQAEIITAGIVAVPAVALPVGIMTVAAHPTINVAMIIILQRLVAAVAPALVVIGWIIAAVAGDVAIDPGNRWDLRGRLLLVAPRVGVHRSARRWVRVVRRRCHLEAVVQQEVGLRVVSGMMDGVG